MLVIGFVPANLLVMPKKRRTTANLPLTAPPHLPPVDRQSGSDPKNQTLRLDP